MRCSLYVCAVVDTVCGGVFQAQTGEGGKPEKQGKQGKQGGENPTSTEVQEDDANVSSFIP